jgi:hypothetical protein
MSQVRHHVIKEAGESLGQLLQGVFRDHGYRRVHLVVAAPKQDAIEGKMPAVGVYLYNITVDEEGIYANHTGRIIEKTTDAAGRTKEVAKRMPLWVRLDYLITTWAQTPEEEHLLMGAAIKGLIEHPTITEKELKGESWPEGSYLPIILSQKLDEGVLSRFWSSLSQPLKPAIQCWTTVPVYPDGEVEIQRVIERDVRFFDLNKMGGPK